MIHTLIARAAVVAALGLSGNPATHADEQLVCPETGTACGPRGSAPCAQGSQTFDGCYFVEPSNAHLGRVSKVTRRYYVVDFNSNCEIPDCGFTLEIRPVANYGGHCHSGGSRPAGTPAAGFYDYAGPVTIAHTLPEYSGPIVVIASPNSNCYNNHPNATIQAFYLCVMEPGHTSCTASLTTIPPDPSYVDVPGILGTEHGDCRYVAGFAAESFLAMCDAYRAFGGVDTLQFADRSLIWGGAVDRAGDWDSGFFLGGHRTGDALDIKLADETFNPTVSIESFGALLGAIEVAGLGYSYEPLTAGTFMHIYQIGVGGAKFGESD